MTTLPKAMLAASALLLTTALGGAGPSQLASTRVEYLRQNWGEQERQWFYHASQGTRLLPMAWFLALEQPRSDPSEAPPFSDPEHLARFGFLPDPVSPTLNPHGLPVGFAEDRGEPPKAGDAPQPPRMGLTCAACHTGEVEHRGRRLRIDGGPAMVDFGAFQKRLEAALEATAEEDERFDRFAARVLKSPVGADTSENRAALRGGLRKAVEDADRANKLADDLKLEVTAEGPGRLDALGRGGNLLFGEALRDPRNFAKIDAPVSFPALWDTAWFRWAQYNGSIAQPMARNVAEALGVRAEVQLIEEDARYRSSVRMREIDAMERSLAGEGPGQGLRSPAWPEKHLGPIDRARAERGRGHHERLCAGCHQGWNARSTYGRPEVRLTMVGVRQIGTDPNAAMNFVRRTVHLPWEPSPVTAAEALRKVTDGVMERWFAETGVAPEDRWEMGVRSENEWRAAPEYRARPLNGIWATAPYLHNGSVPNLYELLLPADQRSAVFHVGSRKFDPRRVGFDGSAAEGRFRFDTSLPGNSNRGHEFRDGPRGNGVIGPALSEEQRWDLIEFLKTQ